MRQPNAGICPQTARTAWDLSQVSQPVTVQCTLITPMYGGGVTPGVVDGDMPIRASAIRGQLRFWWRLLNRAGKTKTSSDLFKEECALWGGISGSGRPRSSQVTLQVKAAPVQAHQLAIREALASFPGYALILNPGDVPKLLKPGYPFGLVLQFAETITPPQREQVIEALRWWASFSGVGARTRRGLGAVSAVSNDVSLAPVCDADVSGKGGWMVLRTDCYDNASSAWSEGVERLRDFRQKTQVGRDLGDDGYPGRSRWPEPDAIRRLPHVPQPTCHPPVHPVDGFYPRAAFGLPIVFQFKRADVQRGDPPGHILKPKGHDRMASPLVLRPYFDGTKYRPLALLLPGWEKRVSVDIHFGSGAGTRAWPDSTDATDRTTLASQIEPMNGRGTDALTAFMDYFLS